MKTRIPTIQVIVAICCGQASLVLCAQTNDVDLASAPSYEVQAASGIGLGLMVGEPTGLTVKGWLSEHSAIDGGVGGSFDGQDNLHFHADYLYHVFDLIDTSRDEFVVYIGAGLRYKILDRSEDRFGFRLIGGVDYMFERRPVDVFLEVGPVFDIEPRTDVNYTVAVGARFWF